MNLQESIRRILRENDYSPAGKEVIPNKIVVHKSNPMFRDKILQDGLKVKAGECYKIYVGYGTKCKPAIFATNSTNKRAWFDSTYDDDVWEINTEMIPDVKWFKDRHYESRSKHIVTFQDIPRDAITLKHEGSGIDVGMLEESIRRILREERELPIYFKRRIDMETLEQIYQYVLKVASKRYTDKKKQLNAMTPYKFNHLVTSNLIEDVCENFELECGDDENRFNQLWDFLNDRYSKRNVKHFYDIR